MSPREEFHLRGVFKWRKPGTTLRAPMHLAEKGCDYPQTTRHQLQRRHWQVSSPHPHVLPSSSGAPEPRGWEARAHPSPAPQPRQPERGASTEVSGSTPSGGLSHTLEGDTQAELTWPSSHQAAGRGRDGDKGQTRGHSRHLGLTAHPLFTCSPFQT